MLNTCFHKWVGVSNKRDSLADEPISATSMYFIINVNMCFSALNMTTQTQNVTQENISDVRSTSDMATGKNSDSQVIRWSLNALVSICFHKEKPVIR